MTIQKIAVLTSGGDAPGMNAAIRAVTRTALSLGWEVVGVRDGYAGLLKNQWLPMTFRSVSGIIQSGGTQHHLQAAESSRFMRKGPLRQHRS